jgi:nicotinamide mononucleotide transporter
MNGLLAAIAANWLEITAVAFGLLSVWLSTREHIASWPTAIINVAIFFVLFWQAKLYADSVLQLFYLSLSAYGWWAWLHGGAAHDRLRVSRATRKVWGIGLPAMVAFGLGLGALLSRNTDSPVPYLDAMLTSASLLAQWMMTRKILENWTVWIVADIIYVPTFIARGLPITAVQYAVFLILAVMGYVSWKRSWATDQFVVRGGDGAPVLGAAGAGRPA